MRLKFQPFMVAAIFALLATSAGYAMSMIPRINITEPSNGALLVIGILGLVVSRYLSPKPQAKNS